MSRTKRVVARVLTGDLAFLFLLVLHSERLSY